MDYSLKRVNKFGAVDEVVSIDVGSDSLALAWGRLFSLGDEVEVWRGARHLTTIVSNGAYRRREQNKSDTL